MIAWGADRSTCLLAAKVPYHDQKYNCKLASNGKDCSQSSSVVDQPQIIVQVSRYFVHS